MQVSNLSYSRKHKIEHLISLNKTKIESSHSDYYKVLKDVNHVIAVFDYLHVFISILNNKKPTSWSLLHETPSLAWKIKMSDIYRYFCPHNLITFDCLTFYNLISSKEIIFRSINLSLTILLRLCTMNFDVWSTHNPIFYDLIAYVILLSDQTSCTILNYLIIAL